MAPNGIFFSGLASGLDTQAIIDQLIALERIPIQQLEAHKAVEDSKLDLLGTLESLVEKVQGAAEELRSASKFFSYTVGVNLDGVATISASGGAQAGSHTLEVVRTAAIDRWTFDGVTDDEADLATADGQQVSFDVNGTTYTASVTAAASTVYDVASAINTVADEAVSASVVNVGTDLDPLYQIVISSRNSGEDFRITNISNTIAGLDIDTTEPNGSGVSQSVNNITVGMNALARVDGLDVERSDNDFSDVVPGLSIDLLSANEGQEMTFTVEADREAIKGRIEDLVDTYNAVIDFVNKQNRFSEEEGAGGDLFGDSILRRVRTDIRSALFDVDLATIHDDTEGYSTLSLVGVKQGSDGRLSIDGSVLDAKMNENLELFAELFVDSDGFERVSDEPNTPGYFQDATADSGLADTLWRVIDRMLNTQEGPIVDQQTGDRLVLDGLFTAREKVVQKLIDRYDERIEEQERRLEIFEESLVKRFAALETLMSQLNARGAALSNSLLALTGANAN